MTTQSNLPLVWALNGGVTDPGDTIYTDGWVSQIPSYQNFNFVLQNNSKNILVSAEQGYYEWDEAIAYDKGATVLSSGVKYFAMSANTGIDPSTDTSFATWTTGTTLSSSSSWGLTYRDGFKLGTVNVRTSSNLWGGNDLTIQNGSPNVFFRTASGATKNWLLSNVSGNMVLVDCATVNQPDDRDISIGGANTYKLYHEGFKPTQSDVSGTIPDAPADGPIYGRSNTAWVKVTSTTVSTSPPPAVAGSGQGWYNLDDGTTYVDVNDGNTSQWVPASPPTLPVSKAVDVTYDDTSTNLGDNVQEALDNVNGVGPNLITNSNFQVRSRGYNFTNNGYSLDQWVYTGGTGNRLSGEIAKPSAPFSYTSCLRKSGTTFIIAQRKPLFGDGLSVYEYSGKTYTASMYISNQITSQIAVPWGIYLNHTGGSAQLLLGTYDQDGTTATATFTMPDLSGYTVDEDSYIEFRMLNISTGVVLTDNLIFECSKFKIEPGSIYTGYEPKPYAVDEAECKRWLYIPTETGGGGTLVCAARKVNAGTAGSNTTGQYSTSLLIPHMAAEPTVTIGGLVQLHGEAGTAVSTVSAVTAPYGTQSMLTLAHNSSDTTDVTQMRWSVLPIFSCEL